MLALVLAATPSLLLGQNPQVKTKVGRRFPTIVFSSVLWRADPPYYSIAIDSAGTATYQSAPAAAERTGVPYTIEFQASDRTRRTAFNLARRLHFFAEDVSVSESSPEKASVQTLLYQDGDLVRQVTFSASPDPDLEELASVFEEISETLEFGRRLSYLRQSNPRALAYELSGMEKKAEQHVLREFEALIPLLRSMASDQNLRDEVRQQAESILRRMEHPHEM